MTAPLRPAPRQQESRWGPPEPATIGSTEPTGTVVAQATERSGAAATQTPFVGPGAGNNWRFRPVASRSAVSIGAAREQDIGRGWLGPAHPIGDPDANGLVRHAKRASR